MNSHKEITESLRVLDELMFAAAKKHEAFNIFYKKYKNPKGYTNFADIAARLTQFIMLGEHPDFKEWIKIDESISQAIIYAARLRDEGFQVYWLDKELAESFLYTDIPDDLSDLEILTPNFILMLPPFLKNPSGTPFDWLFFNYVTPESLKKKVMLGNVNVLQHPEFITNYCKIAWTSSLIGGETYTSTTEIRKDEKEQLVGGNFLTALPSPLLDVDISKEQAFIAKIKRILINTLFYLQLKPDETEEDNDAIILSDTSGMGFNSLNKKDNKNKKEVEYYLNPIWIGKNYRLNKQKLNKKDFDIESRKYKVHTKSFWRRGHYRRVPIGKRGGDEYKLVRIEPTLITRQ